MKVYWEGHTILLCNLNSPPRLLQVGACHHKFLATHILSSLDNVIHVVVMNLLSMVITHEDRVTEIDSDLAWPSASELYTRIFLHIRNEFTNINISDRFA